MTETGSEREIFFLGNIEYFGCFDFGLDQFYLFLVDLAGGDFTQGDHGGLVVGFIHHRVRAVGNLAGAFGGGKHQVKTVGYDNLNVVGERIWNMERDFNLAAGITAADDTLPERLLKEAAKTGPAAGKVNELDKMLPEYYELRGWSTDGIPTAETRGRLGLTA